MYSQVGGETVAFPKRGCPGWGKWDEIFSIDAHFSPLIVEGPSAQTESLIEATKDEAPAQNQ